MTSKLSQECVTFFPSLNPDRIISDALRSANDDLYSSYMYNLLKTIISSIPANTEWSVLKTIGYVDARTGTFGWHALSISEIWNMQVGYLIMLEAVLRKF
jgi:hypothetical protein